MTDSFSFQEAYVERILAFMQRITTNKANLDETLL